MEVNKNILNNLIDILLVKTKVIYEYKNNINPSFDKYSKKYVNYKVTKLLNCFKLETNYKKDEINFLLNYYIFYDKVNGLNNINFNDDDFKEPIVISKKTNIVYNKDLKTNSLNIYLEKELSVNYFSVLNNTIFMLMDKSRMEGIVNSIKRTDKTNFKNNIGNTIEIRIFYNNNISDIYGVIYQSSNLSIGKNFEYRFYKNITL